MRSLKHFAPVVLLLAVILAGCDNQPRTLPVIRLGYSPHDHHAALFMAAQLPDYFKEHGGIYLRETSFLKKYDLFESERLIATVLIDSTIGGQEIIQKLSEDQYDLAFGGVPAIISFIDRGSSIKILMPVMADGSELVVRNDLSAASWDEFVGYIKTTDQPVKIGFKTEFSVQNLIVEHALRELGIPYSEKIDDPDARVILVNLHGEKNLIPALTSKLIDGFVVNQPIPAIAEYEGAGKIISSLGELPPPGKWRGHPCCALAGCEKFVKSEPAAVASFVALMMRANQYITDHPGQSADLIARWLELPVAIEEKSLPTIRFKTDFDEQWQQGIRFWVEALNQAGQVQGAFKDIQPDTIPTLLYDRETFNAAREKLSSHAPDNLK